MCEETIGLKEKKCQDWFEENNEALTELMDRKRSSSLSRTMPSLPQNASPSKNIRLPFIEQLASSRTSGGQKKLVKSSTLQMSMTLEVSSMQQQ